MFNKRIDVLHPCTNPQLKLGVIKMGEGDLLFEYTDAHEIALPPSIPNCLQFLQFTFPVC